MSISHTARLLLASAVSSAAIMAVMASPVVAQQVSINNVTPVTKEMLLNPPAGDWLMWRRTYNGWGYSPLEQINAGNVKDLKLAWAWGMTPGGRSQETPVVHDGILYLQNSTGLIQSFLGNTGDLVWEYQHKFPATVTPSGERSKAIYGDNLIVATKDLHLLALNAKTGKLAWDKQVADHKMGYSFSSGPIIANGVIVQGTTGCGGGQAGGCFITGHDTVSGKELWRIYTIARGDTPEGRSWNGLPLESRYGASAWISGAYDPEQNLVFMGVGQPYPWNAEMSGLSPKIADPRVTNDALYSNSTLAIDPNTGALKWYHQYLKNDTLDLDYVYERILVDLPVGGGQVRKQVVTTGKLGIIESVDRTNGQWLWAKETVPQNVVASIDQKSGEKTINQAAMPKLGQTTQNCPADPGGKAWQATSYSPRTQMLYVPTAEFCSNTTVNPLDPGMIYTGGGLQTYVRVSVPGGDNNIGQVRAINMNNQTQSWIYRQRAPITSSTLPTGGGVVFVGSLDRKLFAFDEKTGAKLWTSPTLSNSLESFPITYMSGGKQYVAVVANWSSGLGRLASLTPEIKLPVDNPATLYVFTLP